MADSMNLNIANPATLSIEFGNSTSLNFEEALSIAKRTPDYRLLVIGQAQKHHVCFNLSDLSSFIQIADLVLNWKSTSIFLGQRLLKKIEYWKIKRVFDCYSKRCEFINQKFYCKTDLSGNLLPIPCKLLGLSSWRIKTITKKVDGKETLDKERLMFEVEREIRGNMVILCPQYHDLAFEQSIQELPETIPATNINIGGFSLKMELKEVNPETNQPLSNQTPNSLEKLLDNIDQLDKLE